MIRRDIGNTIALLITMVPALLSAAGGAGQPRAPQPGPAAFLFEYRPKPGLEAKFDEAYRTHLGWHRDAGDPLSWYAWYVTTGERLGVFIDGTFGIPFGAFDARVDPKGDGEHFDRTAGPLADALSRSVYRLRPELGTVETLEQRTPTQAIEVTHVVANPASTARLERALAAVRVSHAERSSGTKFTWYQLVAGGEQPAFLLLIPRTGWAEYDTSPRSGIDALLMGVDPARRGEIERAFREDVERMWTETWSYRADLSLISRR